MQIYMHLILHLSKYTTIGLIVTYTFSKLYVSGHRFHDKRAVMRLYDVVLIPSPSVHRFHDEYSQVQVEEVVLIPSSSGHRFHVI